VIDWPIGSAWNDAEIRRFTLRVEMFSRSGFRPKAETWAEKLVYRDRDGDDRRVCVECAHMQRDHGCWKAKRGQLEPGVPKDMRVMPFLLQRCPGFEWRKP
jgi:hypothetical protein